MTDKEEILNLLNSKPLCSFSAIEISFGFGWSLTKARNLLNQLAKEGQAQRTSGRPYYYEINKQRNDD